MRNQAHEMNTLPSSFVDQMIHFITSPTGNPSPHDVNVSHNIPVLGNSDDQVSSPMVLNAPTVIEISSAISTSWLQQSLEKEDKESHTAGNTKN